MRPKIPQRDLRLEGVLKGHMEPRASPPRSRLGSASGAFEHLDAAGHLVDDHAE